MTDHVVDVNKKAALGQIESYAATLHTFCEDFECDHGEYYEGESMTILDVIAMLLRGAEPDGSEGKLELDRKIMSMEYDRDGRGVMKVATERADA